MALDEHRLQQCIVAAAERTPAPAPERLGAIGTRVAAASRHRRKVPPWLMAGLLAGAGAAAAGLYWGLGGGDMTDPDRPAAEPTMEADPAAAPADPGSRPDRGETENGRRGEGESAPRENPVIYMR